MRTADEIRGLLSEKFSKEKKRLKTYGTKANSFDLANAVFRYVVSLMCESRYRELKRLKKNFNLKYLKERLKATKDMTKVLDNFAKTTEDARPYNPKKHKKEKGHGKHKHNRHHRH